VIFMPIDALSVSCAQLTRDLLAIAKFLLTRYLKNGTIYRHSFNGIIIIIIIIRIGPTNRDLHTPYSTVSFRMMLCDIERLSKIFARSLR